MNERFGRDIGNDWKQSDRGRYGYVNTRRSQQWSDEGREQDQGAGDERIAGQMGGYSGSADYANRSGGSRGYASREDYERDTAAWRGARRRGYGPSHFDDGYGGGFGSFTGSDYGGRDFVSGGRGYGAGGTGYGMISGDGYRSDHGYGDYGYRGARDYESGRDWRMRPRDRDYDPDRGFLARAGDEIASWFGDEDAARRRELDHRGRGPANYIRSDERIMEDANDILTRDWAVDASDITVTVRNGEVTLDGTVSSRMAKRRAEDCAEDISGVKHVQNNLRVKNAITSETSGAAAANAAGKSSAGTTAH